MKACLENAEYTQGRRTRWWGTRLGCLSRCTHSSAPCTRSQRRWVSCSSYTAFSCLWELRHECQNLSCLVVGALREVCSRAAGAAARLLNQSVNLQRKGAAAGMTSLGATRAPCWLGQNRSLRPPCAALCALGAHVGMACPLQHCSAGSAEASRSRHPTTSKTDGAHDVARLHPEVLGRLFLAHALGVPQEAQQLGILPRLLGVGVEDLVGAGQGCRREWEAGARLGGEGPLQGLWAAAQVPRTRQQAECTKHRAWAWCRKGRQRRLPPRNLSTLFPPFGMECGHAP